MRNTTTALLIAVLAATQSGCGSNDIKAKIDPNTLPSSARIYVPGMT